MRRAGIADTGTAARRGSTRERRLSEPIDLERFHAGDELLFAQLVREHSPRVLACVRRYARAHMDAHDLLQETWLRVYRKRRTYDARGSFTGWLLAVARSVGLNAVTPAATHPGQHPVTHALEAPPHDVLLRELLHDAVLTLSQRQRDVLLLRLVEGMSTAETAERLGCAQGTVKATLHQAIHKLQLLLEERV